jgi:hypothetical protein
MGTLSKSTQVELGQNARKCGKRLCHSSLYYTIRKYDHKLTQTILLILLYYMASLDIHYSWTEWKPQDARAGTSNAVRGRRKELVGFS